MYYEEIRPHPIIAKFVKLIWIQEFNSPGKSVQIERIVADGIVEVVFHFGDPFITYYTDNTVEKQSTSFAIAQLNRPIQIQPNGRVGIIAIRFFPWGAYHFFNTPIHEFADKAITAKNEKDLIKILSEFIDSFYNSTCSSLKFVLDPSVMNNSVILSANLSALKPKFNDIKRIQAKYLKLLIEKHNYAASEIKKKIVFGIITVEW